MSEIYCKESKKMRDVSEFTICKFICNEEVSKLVEVDKLTNIEMRNKPTKTLFGLGCYFHILVHNPNFKYFVNNEN